MSETHGKVDIPDCVDFIVVGGGQSGLVVASRLSEDPSTTVLVIEAGSDRRGDPKIDIPGLMTTLYDNPDYDWKSMTVPQEKVNNRSIAWPRGKVLGGTSAMNFSALVYPARSDFDNWASLVGDDGWNSESMAFYLRKFHKYEKPHVDLQKRMMMDWVDEKAQGYDGPLAASFTDELGPFNEAFVKTFEALHFDTTVDPISGDTQGAFQNPLSIENGVRAYSASAYYRRDVSRRPNLHVITDALVEKIILEKLEDGPTASGQVRATGVQFAVTSGQKIAHARKEVIVACGAIKSPQLLELSGIGDREHLSRHGIETFVDNKQVGENLQDHPLASISFEIADDQISGDIMRDPKIVQAIMEQYQVTGKGPLSGTPLTFAYTPLMDGSGIMPKTDVEELLRVCLENVSHNDTLPSLAQQSDILRQQLLNPRESTLEFMYIPLQLNGHPDGGPTDMTRLFSKAHDGNYISIVTMLMHPFSRGNIHIVSSDPKAQPRIDPRYLSHPLDLEMLARAIEFIKVIANTEPFASLLKRNGRQIPPMEGDGIEEAKRIVRERLFTAFHPSGTCAMLPRGKGGVVDSRLRVYGTTNVRVVDASIFPIEPLGHVQSTVYAVAERAADLIKAD
ncbi:hypothetical protein N0V93_009115 [Gnomoniopsis smithogilvyi]|uniref:Glucose-methanol-choline oxidoreductase N-terminal domain-containing protein n=1 Tax=Gnomoniopsis smithogilvyi TaxID=1191159 RepID=A0A9W8YJE5_9PEZI|nr:hypothetical protein N0V93_009115 [Gnomoniopsis smithogilvyi]